LATGRFVPLHPACGANSPSDTEQILPQIVSASRTFVEPAIGVASNMMAAANVAPRVLATKEIKRDDMGTLLQREQGRKYFFLEKRNKKLSS
jgi:hypothetical protein